MKVSTTKITVEIDLAEWNKIKAEWEPILLGEDQVIPSYKRTPSLCSFMNNIDTIAKNPSYTIEEKL